MSLAFVNRAENTISASLLASAATSAVSHTAGNLLVLATNFQTSGSVTGITVSDTAGNTWNAIGSPLIRSSNRMQLWYALNCLGNASNIVTITPQGANSAFLAVSVRQFSGADLVSVLDGTNSATGTSASINSGSVAVTASSAVIVAFAEADNKNFVRGTGYTLDTFAGASGAFFADEYHIVTASEAATASCTSGPWGVVAAAFKVASSGTVTPWAAGVTHSVGAAF